MTLAVVVTACNGVLLGLEGSGTPDTEARSVTGFDAVVLEGQGTVTIDVGPAESLTIEADDNLLEHLTSEVENGTLVLGTDRQLDPRTPIVFTITAPSLRSLEISGSGNIVTSAIDGDELELSVSGSGNISVSSASTMSVVAGISGSGNVSVAGSADHLSVDIAGSGNFLGFDLTVGRADVTVSGSGNADVTVTDALTGGISGSGAIEYVGSPEVDVSVEGSGRLSQR